MLGRFDEALATYDEMQTVVTETLPPESTMHGTVLAGRARVAADRGLWAESDTLFAASERNFAAGDDSLRFANAATWAQALLEQGRDAEAEKMVREALPGLLKDRAPGAPIVLRAEALRGQALARLGQVDEGVAMTTGAVEAFVAGNQPQALQFADIAFAHADALRLAGRAQDARAWHARGLAAMAATVPADHPRLARLRGAAPG